MTKQPQSVFLSFVSVGLLVHIVVFFPYGLIEVVYFILTLKSQQLARYCLSKNYLLKKQREHHLPTYR